MENNIRKLDELGRIVLPLEIRKRLDWNNHDELELIVDNKNEVVFLKKYTNTCFLCNSPNDLIIIKKHHICQNCIEEIKSN